LCSCNVDATIVGTDRAPPDLPGISLAPCTPNRHCGFCTRTMQGETLDHKLAGRGQLFRILAFNVRGKTVVAYLESGFAIQPKFPPAETFPTFLLHAQRLLSALSLPS
jgi:hypothetical protein